MPPSLKTNKRDGQKEETRVKLLEATVDCLNELGFHRTTTPEVCRRAGVAQGTFFYHFASKEGVMAALAAYIQNLLLTQTEDYYLSLAGEEPTTRLSKLLDYIWLTDHAGRYNIALKELGMAARSDQGLAERIKPDAESNTKNISERWGKYLRSASPDLPLETVKDMVYIFIAGIAPAIGDKDMAYQQSVFEAWKKMILPMLAVKEENE